MQAIQPTQFRIARPILNGVPGRRYVLVGENPSQVRPPETGGVRRVRIVRRVREAVMLAVMRRPPQRSLLERTTAEEGDEELHHSPHFVRAVSEITVIAGRDAEHAHEVKDPAKQQGGDIDAGEQDSEASDVQSDERHRLQPVGELG